MKRILFSLLLTTLPLSNALACVITFSNQADHDNPIIVQKALIASVVLRAHQEVWLTLVTGEEYRITERIPEVQKKMKECN